MKNLLSGVASFFIPGLGQLLKSRVLSGVIWFVVALVVHGASFSGLGANIAWIPGFAVHVLSALNAAK